MDTDESQELHHKATGGSTTLSNVEIQKMIERASEVSWQKHIIGTASLRQLRGRQRLHRLQRQASQARQKSGSRAPKGPTLGALARADGRRREHDVRQWEMPSTMPTEKL